MSEKLQGLWYRRPIPIIVLALLLLALVFIFGDWLLFSAKTLPAHPAAGTGTR
jgi:hypothetical protein